MEWRKRILDLPPFPSSNGPLRTTLFHRITCSFLLEASADELKVIFPRSIFYNRARLTCQARWTWNNIELCCPDNCQNWLYRPVLVHNTADFVMNCCLSLSYHYKWKRTKFIRWSPKSGRSKKIKYAKNLANIQVHYGNFHFRVDTCERARLPRSLASNMLTRATILRDR